MKITVKSLQGDEYVVEVQDDQLVSDIKASISEKAAGLPIEKQKLVYKGRTMQDTNKISEYGLEEGCKVHLILQKDKTITASNPTSSSTFSNNNNNNNNETTNCKLQNENNEIKITVQGCQQQQQKNVKLSSRSRFEIILRERLAKHFEPNAVDKIMANLEDEINSDINSSSLDDLERLAKQKLNISNE